MRNRIRAIVLVPTASAGSAPRAIFFVSPEGRDEGVRVELPSSVEDAFEVLREPGERYLDRAARTVHWIPTPARDILGRAGLESPYRESLLGEGTPGGGAPGDAGSGGRHARAPQRLSDRGWARDARR